jgi:TolA-binding protein
VLAANILPEEHQRQALFRHGEAALFAGDDAAARQQFEEFLRKYRLQTASPPSQAAYVLPYLADILFRAGEVNAAREKYEQALQHFPTGAMHEECQLGLAEIDRHAGDAKAAIEPLRRLVQSDDDAIASRALFALGDAYNRTTDFAQACATFAEFTQRFPRHELASHATLAHAWALYKQQKYSASQELLQQQLLEAAPAGDGAKPLFAEARYWLGMNLLAESSYELACESLAAAEGELPDRLKPSALFHQAHCQLQLQQPAQASELFDRLLSQWPNDAYADDALFGKLQATIRLADHATAITLANEFNQRFANSPLNADGECPAALAVCHAHLAQWDLADAALKQLAQAVPHSALLLPTRYNVAEAAFSAGNYEFAAAQFGLLASATEEANGSAPQAWIPRGKAGLAYALAKQGKRTESIETLETLLKEFPQHEVAPAAALTLGELLQQFERFDAALLAYKQVTVHYADSPQAPRAMLQAAALHAKLKQFDEADAIYRQWQTKHANHADWPIALLHWGMLAAEQKQAQLATDRWRQLVEQFAAHPAAAEAEYQLALRTCEERKFADCRTYLDLLANHPLLNTPEGTDLAARQHYLTARLSIAEEKWDEVDAPLNELLAHFPQHDLAASAKFWLAEACYRRDEFEKAAAQFALLTEAFKSRDANLSAKVALRHAQSLAQLGKWSDARQLAEAIQRDYADFTEQHEVDYLIGRCFANEAEFTQARKAYSRVVGSPTASKTETAAMAQFMIAETYFHAERYSDALKAYLRVELLYAYPTWQAVALLQAGKCDEQLNRWQQAAQTYSRLLRVYPNSLVAEEAARRLGQVQGRVAQRKKIDVSTKQFAE